jgi:hypothetical protein
MPTVAEMFKIANQEALDQIKMKSLMHELEKMALALTQKNMGSLMFWLRFFLMDVRDEPSDSPWREMLDNLQDYGYMKEAL